jgi:CheY-like chemotaxis protein
MRGSPTAPLRVLVVDDNEDTALSFAFLLRTWGHEVRVVHDGPSAVEAARDFQPEAVLLDLGLPRLDGFEVARRLRLLPESGRTLIVASSGYSRDSDRQRASEVGIDFYLVKPYDPWQLEQLLAEYGAPVSVPA